MPFCVSFLGTWGLRLGVLVLVVFCGCGWLRGTLSGSTCGVLGLWLGVVWLMRALRRGSVIITTPDL